MTKKNPFGWTLYIFGTRTLIKRYFKQSHFLNVIYSIELLWGKFSVVNFGREIREWQFFFLSKKLAGQMLIGERLIFGMFGQDCWVTFLLYNLFELRSVFGTFLVFSGNFNEFRIAFLGQIFQKSLLKRLIFGVFPIRL